MCMRVATPCLHLLLIAMIGAPSLAFGQATPDFSQATAMLNLLRRCHENKSSAAEINRVLSLPGTQLLIQQQNISRRVTREQYAEVLRAACTGKVVNVKAAEPGARAEKGVTGLIQDVGPSLVWGRDHVAELEADEKRLLGNQSIRDAIPLAKKYLPEAVPLSPKLYVVMGGRAGAAAIEDDLYFDVLISDWRSSLGTSKPVSAKEIVEFFAHEAHHLGYGHILDQKRAALTLRPGEAQAWNFLVATMMEGSATLLINGHERLADLEQQPDIKLYLAKVPELLPEMQTILQRALNGPLTDEDYAEATDPFLNMGYHATGAVLLAAIEKQRGLTGVLEVMDDPRRLLDAYNACASSSSVPFQFDAGLVGRIATLGEAGSR